jgi:hypothetical protein
VKVTNGWKRIPRKARIGTAVAVPLLSAVLAGAVVANLTGVLTIGNSANSAAAGQDRDTPRTVDPQPEPFPDTQPVPPPPSPSLSPSPSPTPEAPAPPRREPEHAVETHPAAERPDPSGPVTFLEARLDGRSEVPTQGGPAVGDPDGQARAWVRISGNQLCFSLAWRRLAAVTNAHIHAGDSGRNGPVQVGFFDALPDSLRAAVGCVTDDRSKLAGIVAHPAGHYVNLHSKEAPGGAVRGQLRALAHPVDLLEPVRGPLIALARGDQEVPDRGDLDGAGTGFVRVQGEEVRFGMTWTGIAPPTNAHLHLGHAGVAGGVAIGFFAAPAGLPSALFAVAGTVPVERGIAGRINRDPAGHYVNIHTSEFPKGAIRGQLFRS